ncbi:hypothetical protein CLU79DRAFT_723582 [Phycomyces nitens]|nr:hypothetical protein CLU79DRAFT_723582 [Phycomyces nitens]
MNFPNSIWGQGHLSALGKPTDLYKNFHLADSASSTDSGYYSTNPPRQKSAPRTTPSVFDFLPPKPLTRPSRTPDLVYSCPRPIAFPFHNDCHFLPVAEADPRDVARLSPPSRHSISLQLPDPTKSPYTSTIDHQSTYQSLWSRASSRSDPPEEDAKCHSSTPNSVQRGTVRSLRPFSPSTPGIFEKEETGKTKQRAMKNLGKKINKKLRPSFLKTNAVSPAPDSKPSPFVFGGTGLPTRLGLSGMSGKSTFAKPKDPVAVIIGPPKPSPPPTPMNFSRLAHKPSGPPPTTTKQNPANTFREDYFPETIPPPKTTETTETTETAETAETAVMDQPTILPTQTPNETYTPKQEQITRKDSNILAIEELVADMKELMDEADLEAELNALESNVADSGPILPVQTTYSIEVNTEQKDTENNADNVDTEKEPISSVDNVETEQEDIRGRVGNVETLSVRFNLTPTYSKDLEISSVPVDTFSFAATESYEAPDIRRSYSKERAFKSDLEDSTGFVHSSSVPSAQESLASEPCDSPTSLKGRASDPKRKGMVGRMWKSLKSLVGKKTSRVGVM